MNKINTNAAVKIFFFILIAIVPLYSCNSKHLKYGFIDKTGKIIIDAKYEYASNFSEGLAYVEEWVKSNGTRQYKCYFIDKTGKTVLELEGGSTANYKGFHSVKGFSDGLTCIKLINGECNFIDKTGKVIIENLLDSWDFSDGIACCSRNKKYVGYWYEKETGKKISDQYVKSYSYIDTTGRIVLEVPDYKEYECRDFHEGFVNLYLDSVKGFFDKTGKLIIGLKQYEKSGDFSEGLAWVCKDNKYGYIDKTGNMIIKPLDYDEVGDFSEGLAWTMTNILKEGILWGSYGYIDRTGKMIIEPQEYHMVGNFSEGLARVSDSRNHGYIDKTGKIVIDIQYGEAGDFSEGLAPVKF